MESNENTKCLRNSRPYIEIPLIIRIQLVKLDKEFYALQILISDFRFCAFQSRFSKILHYLNTF